MCSGCAWVSADYARRGKFGGGTKFHALTGFSLARPCSARLEPLRIACVGNQWRGSNAPSRIFSSAALSSKIARHSQEFARGWLVNTCGCSALTARERSRSETYGQGV